MARDLIKNINFDIAIIAKGFHRQGTQTINDYEQFLNHKIKILHKIELALVIGEIQIDKLEEYIQRLDEIKFVKNETE